MRNNPQIKFKHLPWTAEKIPHRPVWRVRNCRGDDVLTALYQSEAEFFVRTANLCWHVQEVFSILPQVGFMKEDALKEKESV